jgi:hypothetical protein
MHLVAENFGDMGGWIMSWLMLFMMFGLADLVVIWFALSGSKRKDDPSIFEVEWLPPEYVFKDY